MTALDTFPDLTEAMSPLKEKIVEGLQALPETELQEVLHFVEFLQWRTQSQDEPLLAIAGSLSGEMLSAEEIEEVLYGQASEEA